MSAVFGRRPGWLEALWLVPAGLASLGFYKAVGVLARRVRAAIYRRQAGDRRWRTLSAETLSRRFALALVSADSRWNAHAIVGVLGPLTVERSVRIEVATATRSAPVFTAVLNRHPRYGVAGSLDSADGPFAAPWVELPVPEPGQYMVVLRYYRWGDSPTLPAVEADGAPAGDALPVSRDLNAFYDDLHARGGPFYVGLHFYVYVMLKYADRLPRDWVEREYLPVANPRTRFVYGAVDAGDRVAIDAPAELLHTHDIHLTVYDLGCFPRCWYTLVDASVTSPPCERRGFFLARIHLVDRAGEGADLDAVRVRIETPT